MIADMSSVMLERDLGPALLSGSDLDHDGHLLGAGVVYGTANT
jgi:hypothetical protein